MSENLFSTVDPIEVKTLGTAHDTYLIAAAIESKKKRKELVKKRGFKRFSPSSFGDCLRKVAYQYHDIDHGKSIDAKLEKIFSTGNFIHLRLQDEFANMGILRGWWKSAITDKVYGKDHPLGIFRPKTLEEIGEKKISEEDEREVSDILKYQEITIDNEEYNFRGKVDGIIELKEGNPLSRYIVDFKTINENSFKRLTEPSPQYVVQVHIYMWLLDIKQSIIFYEDKNRHNIKEFLIPYNDELIKSIKNTALKMKNIVENKGIPKRNPYYTKKSKPCCWCDFKDLCWEKSS